GVGEPRGRRGGSATQPQGHAQGPLHEAHERHHEGRGAEDVEEVRICHHRPRAYFFSSCAAVSTVSLPRRELLSTSTLTPGASSSLAERSPSSTSVPRRPACVRTQSPFLSSASAFWCRFCWERDDQNMRRIMGRNTSSGSHIPKPGGGPAGGAPSGVGAGAVVPCPGAGGSCCRANAKMSSEIVTPSPAASGHRDMRPRDRKWPPRREAPLLGTRVPRWAPLIPAFSGLSKPGSSLPAGDRLTHPHTDAS